MFGPPQCFCWLECAQCVYSWTQTLLGGLWNVHNFCETCTTAGKRAQHLWHVHNISETCTYRILENTGWGLWNMLYPICFPLLRFVCFTLGSDLTKHLYSCVCVWGSCAAQVRRQVEQYLQLAGVWTSCWWRQCGRSRRSGNYALTRTLPSFSCCWSLATLNLTDKIWCWTPPTFGLQVEVFYVGSEAAPFLHQATITLHGDRWNTIELPVIGSKMLAVTDLGGLGTCAHLYKREIRLSSKGHWAVAVAAMAMGP